MATSERIFDPGPGVSDEMRRACFYYNDSGGWFLDRRQLTFEFVISGIGIPGK
jgi:hypothetical protein